MEKPNAGLREAIAKIFRDCLSDSGEGDKDAHAFEYTAEVLALLPRSDKMGKGPEEIKQRKTEGAFWNALNSLERRTGDASESIKGPLGLLRRTAEILLGNGAVGSDKIGDRFYTAKSVTGSAVATDSDSSTRGILPEMEAEIQKAPAFDERHDSECSWRMRRERCDCWLADECADDNKAMDLSLWPAPSDASPTPPETPDSSLGEITALVDALLAANQDAGDAGYMYSLDNPAYIAASAKLNAAKQTLLDAFSALQRERDRFRAVIDDMGAEMTILQLKTEVLEGELSKIHAAAAGPDSKPGESRSPS